MKQITRRTRNVVDLTKTTFTLLGIGITPGNPRKCATCHKPIERGQKWQKQVSAIDPKLGRYTTIQHVTCIATKGKSK